MESAHLSRFNCMSHKEGMLVGVTFSSHMALTQRKSAGSEVYLVWYILSHCKVGKDSCMCIPLYC